LIQNPARLSLSKGQLNLDNEDGNFTLPLEDITCIILESPQITLSSALLCATQEHNIVIVTCDASHMPNGLLLPFQQHSRQSRIAHIQIACSDAAKKRLWQAVIKNKINGQAKCLEIFEGKEKAQRLYALSKRVTAGDNNNIEAQAARDYWNRLLGKQFKRGANDQINAALNYAYAVLRAHIARSQVSYGLLPSFGIHHNSQLNAFNLTDDFIEVFRPFADKMVKTMLMAGEINVDEDRLSVRRQMI
jgi:CRISPR-associated protein Cas1